MKKHVFIDESGTLPDPANDTITLTAVAASQTEVFKKVLDRVKKHLRNSPGKKKTKKYGEIKFYTAGEKTREYYLNLISHQEIVIFSLIIRKGSQRIADTPENYAALSWLLLIDCFAYYQDENINLTFDRHFHKQEDEQGFFDTLESLCNKKLTVRSDDSSKNPGITAADMICGSILYFATDKNNHFYKLISERVASEKIMQWKKAKKKFSERTKKLARTGARAHPKRD